MAITIDGDSGISGVNGSATTPALQGTDSNTGIVFGTDTVQVATGGSTRATVDSSGRLLVGTSSNTALGTDSYLSQIKTSGASAGLGIVRTADSVAPPFLSLAKSRNDGIVQSGDFLGKVQFIAHDGNDYNNVSALISSEVDGTPGSDDVPGRLTFHTTADGASSPTERMRIKKTGHINIGTTIDGFANTADNLTIADSGNCGITIRSGTSSAGSIYFSDGTAGSAEYAGYIDYQHSGNHMRFGTNGGNERMRITNHGRLDVFASNATDAHFISSAASAGTAIQLIKGMHSASGIAAGTNSILIHTNGNIQNTNNSYGSISDIKLKENIADASSQWDDIKAIQIRNYNFKEDTGHPTYTQIGVVAQEIETVSPGLVYETPDSETVQVPVLDENGEAVLDENGEAKLTTEDRDLGTVTKSVNYSVLYMKAVKALQEAQTRIETLETQHADLLARVTALEAA